jgi:hypothetical protein
VDRVASEDRRGAMRLLILPGRGRQGSKSGPSPTLLEKKVLDNTEKGPMLASYIAPLKVLYRTKIDSM